MILLLFLFSIQMPFIIINSPALLKLLCRHCLLNTIFTLHFTGTIHHHHIIKLVPFICEMREKKCKKKRKEANKIWKTTTKWYVNFKLHLIKRYRNASKEALFICSSSKRIKWYYNDNDGTVRTMVCKMCLINFNAGLLG